MTAAVLDDGLLAIRPSQIHGWGLIARRPLAPGDKIGRIAGRLVCFTTTSPEDAATGPDYVGVALNVWIDPLPPFKYLNHSCRPNAAVTRRRTVVALTSIPAGEEITIDYSTTEADPYWSMACSCGDPVCRRKLLPIQITFDKAPVAPPGILRAWRRARLGKC